jgi:hypothetical protein
LCINESVQHHTHNTLIYLQEEEAGGMGFSLFDAGEGGDEDAEGDY